MWTFLHMIAASSILLSYSDPFKYIHILSYLSISLFCATAAFRSPIDLIQSFKVNFKLKRPGMMVLKSSELNLNISMM